MSVADTTIGLRISPRCVSGYFHFHFLDVTPAFWPKSIVSHDHRPKKAYYQMAQINQPTVALPQFTGRRPDAMVLWVANDLPEAFKRSTVQWQIRRAGKTLLEGKQRIDVPPVNALAARTIDLKPITADVSPFDLTLTLTTGQGQLLSTYRRRVRVPPPAPLKAK